MNDDFVPENSSHETDCESEASDALNANAGQADNSISMTGFHKEGNNISTNKKTTDKSSNQTRNDFSASNSDDITKARLFGFLHDLIIASVPAMLCWILGEQFGEHGHTMVNGVCRLLALIFISISIPLNALRYWKHPVKIWLGFVLFSLMVVSLFIWSLKEVPPKYPHFTFSIIKPGTLDIELELTNDFLVFTNFGSPSNSASVGYLIFPIAQDSDVIIDFGVRNNGPPSLAEDVEATISVPTELECEGAPPWTPESSWNMNGYKSLKVVGISIFAGSLIELPDLRLNHILFSTPERIHSEQIDLWSRGKSAPAQAITFQLIFVHIATNAIPIAPFIEQANRTNGFDVINLPRNVVDSMVK